MDLSNALATVTALRSELAALRSGSFCPKPHFPPFIPPVAATLLSGAPSMSAMLNHLHALYPYDRPVGLDSFDARVIIEHLLTLFDDSHPDSHANRVHFIDLFLRSFHFRILVSTSSWDDLVAHPPEPLPIPQTIGPVAPHYSRFYVPVPSNARVVFSSTTATLVASGLEDLPIFDFRGPAPIASPWTDGLVISIAPGFEMTRLHVVFFRTFVL